MEEQVEVETPVPDIRNSEQHVSNTLEEGIQEPQHSSGVHDGDNLIGRSLSATPDSGVELFENEQEMISNVLQVAEENQSGDQIKNRNEESILDDYTDNLEETILNKDEIISNSMNSEEQSVPAKLEQDVNTSEYLSPDDKLDTKLNKFETTSSPEEGLDMPVNQNHDSLISDQENVQTDASLNGNEDITKQVMKIKLSNKTIVLMKKK